MSEPYDLAREWHDARNAALREGRSDSMRGRGEDAPTRAEVERDV